MDKPAPEPEFSRPIEVETLGHETTRFSFEPSAGERAALARRFGLPDIATLRADFEVERGHGGAVNVTGRLKARATQTCVVTLEPVAAVIDEAFSLVYAPRADQTVPEGDDIDPDADDPPEPILDGKIDLGEAAAAQLSLALDPYPRKPGAAFDAEALGVSDGGRTSPFSVLEALRPKT